MPHAITGQSQAKYTEGSSRVDIFNTSIMKIHFVCFLICICLLDLIHGNRRNCRPTSHDILGPYYVPNPPKLLQYCTGDPGQPHHDRFLVHGHVYKSDCSSPMSNTRIEVWQADHSGNYTLGANCRGFLQTDSLGYYEFSTLYPGKYHLFDIDYKRPAHIHFKVYGKRRHKTLVTQLYFAGDSNLGPNDPCSICSSNKNDLIAEVQEFCELDNTQDCIKEVNFDIILERGRGISQT